MAEAVAATLRPRNKRISEKLALTLLSHQTQTSKPVLWPLSLRKLTPFVFTTAAPCVTDTYIQSFNLCNKNLIFDEETKSQRA